MDNLTHSLVGLFLARAGLRKATPQGTAILVLAANIPDIDVVSLLAGQEAYLRWHRHLTHSLILLPLVALLAVALIRLISRKPVQWLPAWGLATLAASSHLLLDLTNIYGVRLLLPFSGRWFHWDLTPVVDLTIWAILALGLLAPALARLVGSEIGDRRPSSGAGWAITALLLLFAYDTTRAALHDNAVAQVDAHHYLGLTPRRTGALPTANPANWTGIAELSNAYVLIPLNLIQGFHPNDANVFYKAEQTPEVDAALRAEPFQRLLEFIQWGLWTTEPSPASDTATRVTLLDLRFGIPRAPGFAATADVDRTGRLLDATFSMSGARPR